MDDILAGVEVVSSGCDSAVNNKLISLTMESNGDAFFVGDLGDIIYKHQIWVSELPRVEPFYAVNCNDDPAVLSVLARLGTGFACANKAEMQKVLGLDVRASHVIYANPCKQSSHIQWAVRHDVNMLTFDGELELYKIKAKHPNAKLIMRLKPPAASGVISEAGMGFGCHIKEAAHLLSLASDLELNVIGLSIHVGANCDDTLAYEDAISSARAVFDLAETAGFNLYLLDLGVDFPGQKSVAPSDGLPFQEIMGSLRSSLEQYFPPSSGIRIVAEIGRFLVASAFTLALSIVAQRTVSGAVDADCAEAAIDNVNVYYVNDGVYGSFSCLLSESGGVEPGLIEPEKFALEPRHVSSIWGPTLDDLDCIVTRCLLPQLFVGDWLIFRDMGAYTLNTAAYLSGNWTPERHYIVSDQLWSHIGNNELLNSFTIDSCER